MRIVLTIFAVALLSLPWLKLIGSVLLLWIGVKLLLPEDDGPEIEASDKLWPAIKTILIADLVMSLDNVIAVAAAAGDSYFLLILGLAISIPARDLRRDAAAEADGALADHHHDRRGTARLRRGRDGVGGPRHRLVHAAFPEMTKYAVAAVGAAFVGRVGPLPLRPHPEESRRRADGEPLRGRAPGAIHGVEEAVVP
jgi:hypothetical protein